jgi:Flp pilus assembly protein TadG
MMARARSPFARSLLTCRAGASAVEFALVAPVFLMMLMQVFNMGQMVYGKVVLAGAAEAAARSSALETADTAAADAIVGAIVTKVLAGASVTSTRKSYNDLDDIGRPERWNDTNNNGTCDANESYVDENRTSAWERDVGATGNGGAGDVVIYSVSVAYNPLFTVPFAPGTWRRTTIGAVAVRKNQPYASQAAVGSAAGTCA